jgi:hypothetical protein
VDVDELRHALGGVVLEAAYLERVLRAVFSALVDSKYAAVVDARMTAASLIEDCEHITRFRTDLDSRKKAELTAALKECRTASSERNRVIHDAWAARPGSVMVTLRGQPDAHEVMVAARTPAEVRQVGDRIAEAADRLKAAMTSALGAHWAVVEDRLRHELGHDVNGDQG